MAGSKEEASLEGVVCQRLRKRGRQVEVLQMKARKERAAWKCSWEEDRRKLWAGLGQGWVGEVVVGEVSEEAERGQSLML